MTTASYCTQMREKIMNISIERQNAAKNLTHLMTTQRPFSYLRLGDGELKWLLDVHFSLD